MSLYVEFHPPGLPGTGQKVYVVVGGWWVCKAILVFYFGPDQALGLGLRLGPSRTINCKIILVTK